MQLNRLASRRTAVTLAVVFAAATGLAACGTEAASAPTGKKPVAHVRPGGQVPSAGADREHLAQSPSGSYGWTDPSNGTVINGKMRLLLDDNPR